MVSHINQHADLLQLYLLTAEDFSASLVCKLWRRKIQEIETILCCNIEARISHLIGEREFKLLQRRVNLKQPLAGKELLKRIFARLYKEAAILRIRTPACCLRFDNYLLTYKAIHVENCLRSLNVFGFGQQFLDEMVDTNFTKEEMAEKFYQLVKETRTIRNTRELSLKVSHITRIPDYVFLMENLRTLDISENYISYLQPDISRFKNLYDLDVRGNPLEQVPEEIYKLDKLHFLNLLSSQQLEGHSRPFEAFRKPKKVEIDIEKGDLTHSSRIVESELQGLLTGSRVKDIAKSTCCEKSCITISTLCGVAMCLATIGFIVMTILYVKKK